MGQQPDRERIEQFQSRVEDAQRYGEEFVYWVEKHPTIDMNEEQIMFINLTLSKIAIHNPMLILFRDAISEICFGVFQLGYRTGWEDAKSDSLLGDKK